MGSGDHISNELLEPLVVAPAHCRQRRFQVHAFFQSSVFGTVII
jgi:hypothetical protein